MESVFDAKFVEETYDLDEPEMPHSDLFTKTRTATAPLSCYTPCRLPPSTPPPSQEDDDDQPRAYIAAPTHCPMQRPQLPNREGRKNGQTRHIRKQLGGSPQQKKLTQVYQQP